MGQFMAIVYLRDFATVCATMRQICVLKSYQHVFWCPETGDIMAVCIKDSLPIADPQ